MKGVGMDVFSCLDQAGSRQACGQEGHARLAAGEGACRLLAAAASPSTSVAKAAAPPPPTSHHRQPPSSGTSSAPRPCRQQPRLQHRQVPVPARKQLPVAATSSTRRRPGRPALDRQFKRDEGTAPAAGNKPHSPPRRAAPRRCRTTPAGLAACRAQRLPACSGGGSGGGRQEARSSRGHRQRRAGCGARECGRAGTPGWCAAPGGGARYRLAQWCCWWYGTVQLPAHPQRVHKVQLRLCQPHARHHLRQVCGGEATRHSTAG